jgi:hypothetical protein
VSHRVRDDGRFIALQQGSGISTMAVDGRRRSRLLVRSGFRPAWSPKGGSIAFERDRDIWVFNLNDPETADRPRRTFAELVTGR